MTTQSSMRVLLIEDNPGDVRLLRESLAEAGAGRFELTHVDRLSAGLAGLVKTSFDVVLLDLSLPDSQGLDTVLRIRAVSNRMPIVVLTGVEDEALGLKLIQLGVQDYLVKGQVTGPLLTRSLRYAVERGRMEEILRESEARFRAIMDNSPALMFLKDVEGRYLLVNRRFEEVFHLVSRDLIGKTDEELFPPAQAAAFRANDRKVLTCGAPMEFEEVALYDDGPHTTIVVKFPLLNAQGGCSALCGIATDITERKREEEERQKLVKDRLLLLESTGEGIYGIDLQGHCTFINSAAARMLGYPTEEVVGRNMHELIHHHRSDGTLYSRAECRIYHAFRSGAGCQVDDEVMWRKNGDSFPVDYSAFPIIEQGEIRGAVVTFTDISTRKKAEEQLRDTVQRVRTLSQRLETVREEERTRIARELHDELGVRLTCLKLDLARLQSLMGEPMFPRKNMEEKIRSMTAEVDSTIASVQGLVAELRPGVLDDLGLVAAIEWQCQDFERRSGIRCCCEAREGDIQLDRPQATAAFRICQEALTNVARHAKATSIRVLVEQLNGDLLLEIQDNGRGIPVEKLTDSASLGLLGMRERAASLGGQIEITGQPGKGTTVMLRLPRSEQADK